jgi:hypothetical protein
VKCIKASKEIGNLEYIEYITIYTGNVDINIGTINDDKDFNNYIEVKKAR